jgi:hypothetical protein
MSSEPFQPFFNPEETRELNVKGFEGTGLETNAQRNIKGRLKGWQKKVWLSPESTCVLSLFWFSTSFIPPYSPCLFLLPSPFSRHAPHSSFEPNCLWSLVVQVEKGERDKGSKEE